MYVFIIYLICLSIKVLFQLCVFFRQRVWCWEWDDTMSFSNDCGNLSFHRESLKGVIQDYVIKFNEGQVDIQGIIADTYELFVQLMGKFKDKAVKARLVAKILFSHIGKDKVEIRSYHFTSYGAEFVYDPKEFFERHMMKISQRLGDFNLHGSDLVFKTISHIHIQLSCI